VSAISGFEIGVKCRRGALILPLPAEEWYEAALSGHGLTEIALDGRCAIRAANLPPIHRDPADRIIVATAATHGLTILTPDALIRAYPGVTVVW
jgi:PIN domain nuclease of toxin-antitoxin system